MNQFPYTRSPYKSAYNHKLTLQKTSTNNTQRRQRKRNIIWFHPPFSKFVVTKIGKTFLRLIDKHFPLEKCPLQEKCLTNNIMYKATSTSNQDNYQHKTYYGITETKFKQRYTSHIKSFRHEMHQSDTELSNELWSIKNNNYTRNIVWEILRKHQTYNPNIKRCSLCLNETLEIAR